MIAFIGSVFSPYYAWSKRQDPYDHCAVNVALYGPSRNLWAMTERGRGALHRRRHDLRVKASALEWRGNDLTIEIDERAAPLPHRLRGKITVSAESCVDRSFNLDAEGRHAWRPIAPRAHVEVAFDNPRLSWRGHGYADANAGAEPLAAAFRRWNWSRSTNENNETAILYEIEGRRAGAASLGLNITRNGDVESFTELPPRHSLPRGLWGVARETRADEDGGARIIRTLEDTPFYTRSLLETQLFGSRAPAMHESLDLDRFSRNWVRALLPFRMPRISR